MTESQEVEKLPVSEKVKCLRFKTLFKGVRWWLAAVLFEAFGRKHIAIYLWFKRGVSGRGVKGLFSCLEESGRNAKKPLKAL